MFLLSNLNNVTYLHASSCILQGFLLLCLSEWFIHSTHKFLDCQEFPPWKGFYPQNLRGLVGLVLPPAYQMRVT